MDPTSKSKRQKMFAVLPTLLTLGNGACGFGSITFAAKVGPEPTEGFDPLFIAGLLIFLAMIFDMLDGSAARWAKQTSDFGAILDSLCDSISCGIAPAFLMLQFMAQRVDEQFAPAFSYHPRLLWVIAVLFVVCSVLRLARFNVEADEDDSHEFFSGLPTPAAAGAIASFPIAIHGLNKLLEPPIDPQMHDFAQWTIPCIRLILPMITLTVACLMVSRIRYAHIFNQLFTGKRNRHHVIQLVFTLAVVYIVRELAVPLIFCFFAFSSPIRALWTEVVSRRLHKQRQV